MNAEVPPLQEIVFVGIGAIGLPMAARIASAGIRVTAVDPSEDQRAAARRLGFAAVAGIEGVHGPWAIVVMVATAEQLYECLCGSGLLDTMPKGSLCVVMSTVGPEVVAQVAAVAAEKGVDVVDAPVTGGISSAESGDLTIFTAGRSEALDRSRDLLEAMGSTVFCGNDPGKGQSFKLVNQLLCSVHLVVAAEALAFAEHLELDPETVHRAVVGGAGSSWMLADRGPRMLADRSIAMGTALDIFVKDSALVSGAAQGSGFEAPLLMAATEVFRKAADLGLGRHDDSRVRDVYGRH
ncbi:UNVERIFIED_CONTAM: 3-hydroxyisobutyrate dehydrogenase/putative dehydrogenase [Williamsia faeni]